jgi:hypothetical protein
MLDFTETDGLFDNFEVNREPFWPRISWLIAGSGAWHLVLLACIILIPPVRNAFNLAVMFSGGGFVDRPYNKTEIGDEGDITEITLEKFHYPEGYFAMDQQGLPIQQFSPPAPFTPPVFSPSQVTTPSPTPAPSPLASPSPAIAANADPANKNTTTDASKQTEAAKAQADKAAEEKLQADREKTAKNAGIEMPEEGQVNKQSFKDLALAAKGLNDKGQLDMNQEFEIVIETELDRKGKLVNPKIVKKSGDAKLTDLSKQFVEAMNDSGVLFYLKALSEDNPDSREVFTIKQDSSSVSAIIESEATSPYSARVLTKGFNAALAYGVINRQGKVEELLLKNTSASQDGKKIVFNFTMPRQAVHDLVKKELASASPTPSGP